LHIISNITYTFSWCSLRRPSCAHRAMTCSNNNQRQHLIRSQQAPRHAHCFFSSRHTLNVDPRVRSVAVEQQIVSGKKPQ
jgi:hypothetical protein